MSLFLSNLQLTGSSYSDVISGIAIEEVGLDVNKISCDSCSKCPSVMNPAHFVMDNDKQTAIATGRVIRCKSSVGR